MINHISKSTLVILFLALFCTSCEFGGLIKDQFSLLIDLRKEFGGEWTNQLSSDCFKFEIVNSPRILNNPDSLDYYGAIIGRKITEKVDNFKPWLSLEIVDKTSVGVAYSSNSSTYRYNLELMKLFDDKPVIDLPNYITASYAAIYASAGNLEDAQYFKDILDSIAFKKDYIDLVDLLIDKQNGEKIDVDRFIANRSDKADSELLHLLVESYKMMDEPEKTAELIELALSKDPDNIYYLMMNGNYFYYRDAFEEASLLFSKIISKDPENLRAWHSRAWSKFKMGKEAEGCEDISQMYVIKPEVNMPDSTKLICEIN